jgi:intron-binding protein aquarius
VRRLTVALSRARLGLYILGRRDVFEPCFELRQAFEILLQRPDQLMLVTGELWPSKRIIAEEEDKKSLTGETVMEGVEHLGQYVYEMTNAKVNQLRAERGLPEDAELPPVAEEAGEDLMAFEDEAEEPVDGFEAEEE